MGQISTGNPPMPNIGGADSDTMRRAFPYKEEAYEPQSADDFISRDERVAAAEEARVKAQADETERKDRALAEAQELKPVMAGGRTVTEVMRVLNKYHAAVVDGMLVFPHASTAEVRKAAQSPVTRHLIPLIVAAGSLEIFPQCGLCGGTLPNGQS